MAWITQIFLATGCLAAVYAAPAPGIQDIMGHGVSGLQHIGTGMGHLGSMFIPGLSGLLGLNQGTGIGQGGLGNGQMGPGGIGTGGYGPGGIGNMGPGGNGNMGPGGIGNMGPGGIGGMGPGGIGNMGPGEIGGMGPGGMGPGIGSFSSAAETAAAAPVEAADAAKQALDQAMTNLQP